MDNLKNRENPEKTISNDLLKTLIEKVLDKKFKHSQIWVPGIIKSFDNIKKTVQIKEFFPIKDCSTSIDYYTALNQINEKYFASYEIPFVNFSTGNFEFSVPLQPGDTVIVLFTFADINSWSQGKTTNPDNWFYLPNNAVAIPCIFNAKQSIARAELFKLNNSNLPSNNVHLMYKNSHIEFAESDKLNITSKELNVNSDSKIQVKSSNFIVSDKVKIATTKNYNILMNVFNQLQAILQALTNIQASPLAPPIASQIASLNVYINQLQAVIE